MAFDIKIPLSFKEGNYNVKDLTNGGDELVLTFGDFNVLTYDVPKTGRNVRLYQVNEQQLTSCLYSTYNADGMLKYVEIIDGDEVRLIYIGYADEEDEREEFLDFAQQSADIISAEILSRSGSFARLFVEYFYDGEGFDYALKLGTPEDMQTMLDSLSDKERSKGLDEHIIDNSGNYPNGDNRIECDSYTVSVMLRCAKNDLFRFVVDTMTGLIKSKVLDKLSKTEDFKFIVSEYD